MAQATVSGMAFFKDLSMSIHRRVPDGQLESLPLRVFFYDNLQLVDEDVRAVPCLHACACACACVPARVPACLRACVSACVPVRA